MTPARQTIALVVLLMAAALSCALAYTKLDRLSARASAAAREFGESRAQLAALSKSPTAGPGAIPQVNELNRRLRDAADASGVADKLISVEPGESNRLPDADVQEMLVFLRLESLTMPQLAGFLHRLASVDPSSHAKTIELSAPGTGAESAKPQAVETWQADVTLSYLSYAPRS